jgi:hypothetical protein
MMVQAIEEFLFTEEAKKMGYDSKADVVTAAVRELLAEYGRYQGIQNRKKVQGKAGSVTSDS